MRAPPFNLMEQSVNRRSRVPARFSGKFFRFGTQRGSVGRNHDEVKSVATDVDVAMKSFGNMAARQTRHAS